MILGDPINTTKYDMLVEMGFLLSLFFHLLFVGDVFYYGIEETLEASRYFLFICFFSSTVSASVQPAF